MRACLQIERHISDSLGASGVVSEFLKISIDLVLCSTRVPFIRPRLHQLQEVIERDKLFADSSLSDHRLDLFSAICKAQGDQRFFKLVN